MTLRHIGLFEGIGGFSLAARWMGWETIAWCEWNEFGQRVLKYHFPKAEGHGDITTTDFRPYRGKCDILTGGFPFQPYSSAGKRLGKEDDRHLWPEMLRAVREVHPKWVVGENVLGIVNWNDGLVFNEVQTDLEAEGYEVQPYVLPACAVNAPHRRDRTWFVAHSNGTIKEHGRRKDLEEKGKVRWNEKGDVLGELHGIGTSPNSKGGCEQGECKFRSGKGESGRCNCKAFTDTDSELPQGRFGKNRPKKTERYTCTSFCGNSWENFPTQSPIRCGNDGLPSELDGITFSKWRNESIKAYGNAIVPKVALQIFKSIEKYENRMLNN